MKLFKKITVSVLTIALLIGIIPSAVFAASYPDYVYDSKNLVSACRITAQVKTNGELKNITGGTVVRTDNAKFFECGGGVWTFKAVPAQGYEFDGWENLLTWQERDWVWESWENFRAVNPNTVKGSYPLAVGHIHNRNGNGAFHAKGLNMSVHHVWCSAPMATKIQNVQYNFIAKFKKIPLTLTINHKIKVVDQNGAELRTDTIKTTGNTTNLLVGNSVKPSQYRIDVYGTFDATQDAEKELKKGSNTLNVFYAKTEYVKHPATLTVNHHYETYDQDGLVGDDVAIQTKMYEDITTPITVTSADFVTEKDDYVYDTSKNASLPLVPGDNNTLDLYYKKTVHTAKPATLTIIRHYKTIDQDNNVIGTVETVTESKDYADIQTVTSADFPSLKDGFVYDASQEVNMPLAPGNENTINVYYVKSVYIDQLVDVKVNHIAITQNSSGTEISRKTLREDIVEATHYEKEVLTSKIFKDDTLSTEFKYETLLDETVTLVYLADGEDGEVDEDANTINVYYVKKLAPPVIIIPITPVTPVVPTNPVVEEIDDDQTPLSSGAETIGDEKTPLGEPTKSPQTGDNSSSAILLALATAAVVGLFARKALKEKAENN